MRALLALLVLTACGREPTAIRCTAQSAYRVDTLPAPNGYIAVVYWCH